MEWRTAASRADGQWYTQAVGDVELAFGTSERGLSATEAAARLADAGPNEIEAARDEPWWSLAVRQFRDPLIYVLLAAAGVTLALRDYADAGVILAVVLLNSAIGFTQEYRARVAMRALTRLSAPHAVVVRDGVERDVESAVLVPGDIVLLTSGARVPADLRLTQAHELSVDESLLTGESDPAEKTTEPLTGHALVAGDKTNMAFAATMVTRGRGRGIVVCTGMETELGRIAHSMRVVGKTTTPLQEVMAKFGRRIGIIIVGLAGVALAIGLARAMPPAEIFLIAVALAVAAIPEGLPVVLTVTLTVGVRRMARRRAIIRSLPAVETLGSTTVIGSDKTGTLTKNEMTVRSIWADGARYDVRGTGYGQEGAIERDGAGVSVAGEPALLATLRAGVLASEATTTASGDPTEIALLVVAAKGGIDLDLLRREHPETDVIPFESEQRFMVSLRHGALGGVEYVKGAPEVVLSRCDREITAHGEVPLDRAGALAAAAAFAADGQRVLAMAYRRAEGRSIAVDTLHSDFVLAGLVGMDDPVRDEAIAAVADARAAGIRVLMLTGDHVDTARAVGKRVGLGDRVVAGHELDHLPDEELDRVLADANIYARVAPEHKLRIVQRLKANGEIVAVTGDGVNDAPALRAAHLGIAMGASGSDVAREASDMILADDNFATITGAVEQGRIVFANVRKVTFFLLSCAVGEILAILTALVAGWPLPFTAAQILWINLVTDGLEDVSLAFEPGEPGLLKRPPRPRSEGVLTRGLIWRLAGVGTVIAATTLGTFWWTLNTTGDLVVARTVAVTQMVVLQFYHTFNCRSLERSVFGIPFFTNRFLLVSMVAVSLAHLAALHIPFLQSVLRFSALTASQWSVVLLAGLTIVVGGELDKLLLVRRRGLAA